MNRYLFPLVLTSTLLLPATPEVTASESTVLMTRPVPVAGERKADVVKVILAPGEASPVHRHDAQTFVYVVSGSVAMAVNEQAPVTLMAGDTFYEAPSDVHTVSRNLSATDNAELLVFLIKDLDSDD